MRGAPADRCASCGAEPALGSTRRAAEHGARRYIRNARNTKVNDHGNSLDRIKIPEPRHPNRSTGIINGQTSGILNWNDIPYPSFYRAYKELSTNF